MPEAEDRAALVTGATSLIGHFLLPRLVAEGFDVHVTSRRRRPDRLADLSLTWHTVDVAADGPWPATSRLFHLAPLTLLPPLVRRLAEGGLRRVVAFGSTSRFTKRTSASAEERALAAALSRAEDDVAAACERANVAWTILRPTLVYGAGLDHNVSAIGRFVQRFRFFPLAGDGRGLRQPVHADDLAAASLQAVRAAASAGRAYDLSGGSTLTYRAMVEEVFRGLGLRPRFVRFPVPFFRAALRCASLAPRLRHLTPSMADRMNEDLVFDHRDAAWDFAFAPREFTFPG